VPQFRRVSGPIRRFLENRPGIGKWTFSTNAVTISGVYGIPAVGFGPGQEVMAHAPTRKRRLRILSTPLRSMRSTLLQCS